MRPGVGLCLGQTAYFSVLEPLVIPLAGFAKERTNRVRTLKKSTYTHTERLTVLRNKVKVLTVDLVLLGFGGVSGFGLTRSWLWVGFWLSLGRVNVLLSIAWAFVFTPRPLDSLRALRDTEDRHVARSRSRFVAALHQGNPLWPVA